MIDNPEFSSIEEVVSKLVSLKKRLKPEDLSNEITAITTTGPVDENRKTTLDTQRKVVNQALSDLRQAQTLLDSTNVFEKFANKDMTVFLELLESKVKPALNEIVILIDQQEQLLTALNKELARAPKSEEEEVAELVALEQEKGPDGLRRHFVQEKRALSAQLDAAETQAADTRRELGETKNELAEAKKLIAELQTTVAKADDLAALQKQVIELQNRKGFGLDLSGIPILNRFQSKDQADDANPLAPEALEKKMAEWETEKNVGFFRNWMVFGEIDKSFKEATGHTFKEVLTAIGSAGTFDSNKPLEDQLNLRKLNLTESKKIALATILTAAQQLGTVEGYPEQLTAGLNATELAQIKQNAENLLNKERKNGKYKRTFAIWLMVHKNTLNKSVLAQKGVVAKVKTTEELAEEARQAAEAAQKAKGTTENDEVKVENELTFDQIMIGFGVTSADLPENVDTDLADLGLKKLSQLKLQNVEAKAIQQTNKDQIKHLLKLVETMPQHPLAQPGLVALRTYLTK